MVLAKFVLKRALQGVFVVWSVITVVFLLRFMTPGSAVAFVAPPGADLELREAIAEDLGINDPIHVQYFDYITGLLQGEMGYSYLSGTEASVRVFARLPATIELAVAATIVAIVIAIPLGVISATRRNEPADFGATFFSLIGISTPNFWLGIMLVLVVAVQLRWLPTSSRPIGLWPAIRLLLVEARPLGLWVWAQHMVLPAITLGTYFTALITRLTRSGMIDELGKDYVDATRAKGLPETLVRYKHVLRNTLIPIITVLGLQLGSLIGGAVITEAVFSWPGLGTLLIDAIRTRDWPIIQGALIVIGIGFVLINTIVDMLYAYVNPRVIAE